MYKDNAGILKTSVDIRSHIPRRTQSARELASNRKVTRFDSQPTLMATGSVEK